LPNDPSCGYPHSTKLTGKHFAATTHLEFLFMLIALALFAGRMAHGQEGYLQASLPEEHPDTSIPTKGSDNGSGMSFQTEPSPEQDVPTQPASDSVQPEEQTGLKSAHPKPPADRELVVEGEGSFGHYHIFAFTWWSELYTGGIEYDRNTWGTFLKAQMDWTMEVLPVTILVQPSKTDIYGDPLTKAKFVNPGLGIYPIGLRMKWRSDKVYQPYFIIKGGMLVFDKKALSYAATYQNFSLQMGIGMQRRLTDRLDIRVGYEDIHFSNDFMVPNNPGLDVMAYDGGIVYRFKKKGM